MREVMGALVFCLEVGLFGNEETYYVHPGSHHFMEHFAVTRLEILAERISPEV